MMRETRLLNALVHSLRAVMVCAVVSATVLVATPGTGNAEIRITEGDDCPDVIAPVAYLYQAFFLREPDPQGLDFWVRWVSSDQGSLSAAAALFATSPEYVERYGEMTNEEFVRALYPNVFGREPDAGGLAFWTNDLEEGNRTRSEVILVWSISEEFVGEDVTPSPLIYDLTRREIWCGTGQAVVEVGRLPLSVGQWISVEGRPTLDQGYLWAEITGLADNGTHVVSTGSPIDTDADVAANLYVHPNLGAAVATYRVSVHGDGPWVIMSEWHPPPWRTS